MRQVSPLPGSGAGIQVPYGKPGMQRHAPHKEPEADREDDANEPAAETAEPHSAAPPGMGQLIDRSV